MGRPSNTKDVFINRSRKKHGDKYDYSKTKYVDWSTYVTITCPIHGDFSIRAIDHYRRGCQKCGYIALGDSKRKPGAVKRIRNKTITPPYTIEAFLFDAEKIHKNRYDYSLVEYKNKTTKVKVICEDHGIFEQTPSNIIAGRGCPKCRNKKSQKQFLEECSKEHNNLYDYSLVKYINVTQKIKIICKEHGEFEQLAGHHLKGCKCPKCQGVFKNKDGFISESILVHNQRYDYSLVNYINNRTPVEIICKEHGSFKQIPKHHLNGCGCPECKNSRGENIIILFLDQLNIKYKRQKTFEGCNHKKKLQFDFYLPTYNMCIEFDGIQHYESIEWFGGDKAFESSKIRDEIKTDFCLNNNIKLIRIRYDEDILGKLSFLKDIYHL